MKEQAKKTKERESKATIRKAFKHGQRTQKMMSFRIDEENAAHLAKVENKGRLINELLAEHFKVIQE